MSGNCLSLPALTIYIDDQIALTVLINEVFEVLPLKIDCFCAMPDTCVSKKENILSEDLPLFSTFLGVRSLPPGSKFGVKGLVFFISKSTTTF